MMNRVSETSALSTSSSGSTVTCRKAWACSRGVDPGELTELLAALAPGALGAQITIFDPDLDPSGAQSRLLAEILAVGLRELGTLR
jgi:hypothetical protein